MLASVQIDVGCWMPFVERKKMTEKVAWDLAEKERTQTTIREQQEKISSLERDLVELKAQNAGLFQAFRLVGEKTNAKARKPSLEEDTAEFSATTKPKDAAQWKLSSDHLNEMILRKRFDEIDAD